MQNHSLVLLLGLSLMITLPVYSKDVPKGSYQLSCSNISVTDDALTATCKKLNDVSQSTTLTQLGFCLNSISHYGDIGNIDGNLVCLPDLPKPDPNFVFPQSETVLNQWIYGGDSNQIYQHGWGIWSGLTQQVGTVDGTVVRAFETWTVPSNIIFRSATENASLHAVNAPLKRPSLELSVPRQFGHGKTAQAKAKVQAKAMNVKAVAAAAATGAPDSNIFVSVAYNPPGAEHAIANRLFYESTLQQYMKNGYAEIPNFPNNSITIKPVYKIISKTVPNGIYTFPGWPGPNPPDPKKGFGESIWNSCVYVDISTPSGPGGNSNDPGCKNKTAANTFYLNNFIHNKISSDNAAYLTNQLGISVSEGDYIILVAMHVTTREDKVWTWQTFWWSANADQPFAPSSTAIASTRPLSYLDEAAKHYAMSVAYAMVEPPQPIAGGKNVGNSVYGYNPYLEAGFGPDTFKISRPINGKINNTTGIQTNCMTCHNMAAYAPQVKDGMPYAADFYISISDSVFNGTLKTDFSWTIPTLLVPASTK